MALPLFALAAGGDFVVTVKSELGYPIPNAGLSFSCNGTSIFGTTTNAAGTVTIATSTLQSGGAYFAAGCGVADGKVITFTATSSAYVSTTTTAGDTRFISANSNNVFTVDDVPYTLKVTSMKRESLDATSIMPQVTYGRPFSVLGSLTLASSSYSSGAWYLAASSTAQTGTTLIATSSGYVNNYISNATTSSAVQRTVSFNGVGGTTYSTSTFLFGLKVTVADPLGNTIVPYSASYNGAATTSLTTSSDGSSLYWANTSGVAGILNIIADGYLWATSTNTGFHSVTTGSTTQVLITMGNSDATTTAITVSGAARGLSTTLKVASFNDELGNSILPTTALAIRRRWK